MTAKAQGADVITELLRRGELDSVTASKDLANRLVREARANLASALTVRDTDPGGAIQLAYDSARKAATSLLAAQGLRPTATGGHVAVQRVVNAQFGRPFGRFSRMRRRRHQQEYPSDDSPTATSQDADEIIDFADQAIETATKVLGSGKLRPWT